MDFLPCFPSDQKPSGHLKTRLDDLEEEKLIQPEANVQERYVHFYRQKQWLFFSFMNLNILFLAVFLFSKSAGRTPNDLLCATHLSTYCMSIPFLGELP